MGSRPVLLESRIIQQTEQKVARSHHESVACERLIAAAAVGALLTTPAGRKNVMLCLQRGYMPARASAHDGPAGVEALRSRPVA